MVWFGFGFWFVGYVMYGLVVSLYKRKVSHALSSEMSKRRKEVGCSKLTSMHLLHAPLLTFVALMHSVFYFLTRNKIKNYLASFSPK